MALTQDQWYQKLKSWVPAWVFEQEKTNVALFKGMAKLLSELQADQDSTIAQTFINSSTAPYLDQIGDERGVNRITGELNPPYRVRIRSGGLLSQLSVPAIRDIVNAILIRGVAAIKEDWEGAVFVTGSFLNRGELLIEPTKDVFSIVVDRQIHEPFSFVGDYFVGDSFCGQQESSDQIFELIIEAVNESKAFGVLYRIVERLN